VDRADLRIVLDTTGGPRKWTATWYAKLHDAKNYVKVRETTRLLNEDILGIHLISNDSKAGAIDHLKIP
jgi:hypothetical protein